MPYILEDAPSVPPAARLHFHPPCGARWRGCVAAGPPRRREEAGPGAHSGRGPGSWRSARGGSHPSAKGFLLSRSENTKLGSPGAPWPGPAPAPSAPIAGKRRFRVFGLRAQRGPARPSPSRSPSRLALGNSCPRPPAILGQSHCPGQGSRLVHPSPALLSLSVPCAP